MVDTESLKKVLELERQKGYQDRAVIGGLDRFIRRWALKAVEGINHPYLLQRFEALGLTNPQYARMDIVKRQRWLEAVLELAQELEHPPPLPEVPPTPRRRERGLRKRQPPPISLETPLSRTGLPSDIVPKLKRLGVQTVRDLLYFFPRRYLDYSQRKTISQLEEGEEATIVAIVWEAREVILGGRPGTEAIVGDETGNIRVVWFNQPYLARRLSPNDRIVLSGRVSIFKGRRVMESPEWEPYEEGGELLHTGRLVPLYHLTEGLHPRRLRRVIKLAVDSWSPLLPDFLPPDIKERHGFLDLPTAVREVHFPDDQQALEEARRRLAFDELFLFQLGVLGRKRQWQAGLGHSLKIDHEFKESIIRTLPFSLTPAQRRALDEILSDMEKPQPMSRLLQGEVGSGKTVVATIALLMAAANERQGVMMAPTEVLAEQHFYTIAELLSRMGRQTGDRVIRMYYDILPRPLTLALLIGSLRPSQKEEVQRLLRLGKIDLVIGTHTLIQKDVSFPSLGLAVIDEQHRFGVLQRSALRQKGFNPHVLVMTATPIPRTLALTIYGDLDLSVIDELPPGRQIAKTKWLEPEDRELAYEFIRKKVAEGDQAFIICPIIEESEALEVRAAVAEYERLSREVFPDLRLGLLHGRMSLSEKEEVMRKFRNGELHILVSTPVVEVGIDVPRATVMLVEGAERFGLAQLHQFRGRVSRAQKPSYCLMVAEKPSPEARERLSIMERISNGFLLAEEDLRLRGPGEFLGTRQSGMPDFKMARLSDLKLLECARSEALRLFEQDPGLEKHELLAQEVRRLFKDGGELS